MRALRSFFVLMMVTLCFARDKTIPLVWRPTDDIAHFGEPDLGRLAELKVYLAQVADARDKPSEIGVNVEKNYPRRYLTYDNVSEWVRLRFADVLRQFGITVARDSAEADIVLDLEIVRFYVTEQNTYKGEVGLKICARRSSTAECFWSGTASGTSNRWGRSFAPENFYECIGNAFLEAVHNFITKRPFLLSIEKL